MAKAEDVGTIGVLGAGNIGGTLGKKWAAAGYDVVFGVRDPQAEKVQQLLAATDGRATATTVGEAVAAADVILLAIPGSAVADTVARLADVLDGKTIVDATNNVGQAVMNSLALLGEYVPKAHCYRAFNNLGWENFADPVFGGVPADLFYCGPAGEARDTVAALIAAVGLRPIYVGDLDQAPVVDNLTRLWFALALEQGYGRHLAFKLLQPE